MDKKVKHYYELANEYKIAAMTLHMQLIESPNLYYPVIFLIRHTIELLLKGLIIQEALYIDSTTKNTDIIISKKSNIDHTHNLLDLWNYYKKNKNDTLFLNLSDEQIISKELFKLNNKDPYSDTFRYPHNNKNQKPLKIKPIDVSDYNICPPLGFKPPTIAKKDNKVSIIKHGTSLIAENNKLFAVIEKLLSYFN